MLQDDDNVTINDFMERSVPLACTPPYPSLSPRPFALKLPLSFVSLLLLSLLLAVTVFPFILCSAFNSCCNMTTRDRTPDCWVPNPSCGTARAFRADITNWLQRSFQPVGGALIALAVLLFLTIIGSCFVSKIGKKQMLDRIQSLAHLPSLSGGSGGSKAAAPYANMA